MADIHGRYRALRWAKAREHAERRYNEAGGKGPLSSFIHKTARPLASWHLRPILSALRSVRRNRSVHKDVGIVRQIVQAAIFAETFKVNPDSYYRHRLYHRWARRRDCIYHDEIVALLYELGPRVAPVDFPDLMDKRRFYRRASSARLPVIPILAEFVNGVVTDCALDPAAFRCDLFSKLAVGCRGKGATLWRYRPDQAYDNGTEQFTLSSLKRHLSEQSFSATILLQPRISNHRELLPISGNALATVRVISVRHLNGQFEIALACYRMGVGVQVVDHFCNGGLASFVDLASGTLGPATIKSEVDTSTLLCHPDTGAAICGTRLPEWQRVKDLALEAHRVFATVPSVGWDIAITDEGPVLVEGNGVWCVELAQMSQQAPLADSIVPDCLAAYLSAFPLAKLDVRNKTT